MYDDRRTAEATRIERRRKVASAILEEHSSRAYELVASVLQSSPETILRHYARTTSGATGTR